jgi:hypothetical protein
VTAFVDPSADPSPNGTPARLNRIVIGKKYRDG